MLMILTNSIISGVSQQFSIEAESLLSALSDIPVSVSFLSAAKLILLLILVTMTCGILFRLVFGQGSAINHAISSAMGILCIYAVTVVIYTLNPRKLSNFLSPLPFVVFRKDLLLLLPFHGTLFSTLCSQILSLLILSFLVNLLDTLLPKGNHAITWYAIRILNIVCCMFLNLTVNWALNQFLPGFLVQYAPMVLLILFIAFLLLGISRLLLGMILTVINPLIGAAYTFFFSNLIGKQLTKAVLSTLLMCLLFFFLESNGYSVISIDLSSLLSYIPMAGIMLVLWYLLGHEL